MKVKLLISRAGAGFAQSAGDVVEVSDKEGQALVRAGKAEPVTTKETADRRPMSRKATKE